MAKLTYTQKVAKRIASRYPTAGTIVEFRPFKDSSVVDRFLVTQVISNVAYLVDELPDSQGMYRQCEPHLYVVGIGGVQIVKPSNVFHYTEWAERSAPFREAGYDMYLDRVEIS